MKVEKVAYKNFIMWACPDHQAKSGKWTLQVCIMQKDRETIGHFLAPKSFDTEAEAARHSIEYGKQIIDRRIPGVSVDKI